VADKVPLNSSDITIVVCMQNNFDRVSLISIKLNILQLKLRHFATMQVICKVITSTLCHQQPISSIFMHQNHVK